MDISLPDITGPIGMLKCLAELRQLPAGDALSFTVRDSDAYRTLAKIFSRDTGCRMTIEEIEEGHHMIVRKL
jgi:TusA-related sulfurtransferase